MSEAAPLVAAEGAPVPEGGAAEWIVAGGGTRLRAALFPRAGARGSVVLSPGRTEPIEKYFEVVDDLRARGFTVLVHDWRGQGLSDRLTAHRLRGHAEGSGPFLSDFKAVLAAFEARLPRPWIGLGHSMGGGLLALALARGETRFKGVMLSAPMLGINLGNLPAALASFLAATAGRLGLSKALLPARLDPLDAPFSLNILTHDEARWDRFVRQIRACPDLRLGGVTWGWLDFALTLSAELQRPGVAESIGVPLLVFAAELELLVDNRLTEAFARRLPNGRLIVVEGARHELLMEIDPVRERVWAAFDGWVDSLLSLDGGAVGEAD